MGPKILQGERIEHPIQRILRTYEDVTHSCLFLQPLLQFPHLSSLERKGKVWVQTTEEEAGERLRKTGHQGLAAVGDRKIVAAAEVLAPSHQHPTESNPGLQFYEGCRG
ncbi:unnamed protein product [Linum tenue]|uniref:Uncharacterized protein n=1 Tax=Linum tenue TaxID=586396 RepID=A0AAV0N560_9ROSI|nr:unnamed protein product [Linum tenue]